MGRTTRGSVDNIEFLISIILVSKPEQKLGMALTIKNHMRLWSTAGICEYVPTSSGLAPERFEKFIEKYSEELEEKCSLTEGGLLEDG